MRKFKPYFMVFWWAGVAFFVASLLLWATGVLTQGSIGRAPWVTP